MEIDSFENTYRSAKSYSGLLQLVEDRYRAGYKEGKRLKEYFILGKLWLDSCGNAMSIQNGKPLSNIPLVLDKDSYSVVAEVEKKNKSPYSDMWSMAHLPKETNVCPHCHKGWDLDNFEDVYCDTGIENISGESFVGRTLEELSYFLDGGYCGKRIHLSDTDSATLRNDKHIDLSPGYPNPKSDWERNSTAVKNRYGWVGGYDGITLSTVIEPGDEIHINTWHYYHRDCYREYSVNKKMAAFQECFEKAGLPLVNMFLTQNQYSPDSIESPWFIVKTPVVDFLVGWRSRVIHFQVLAPDKGLEAKLNEIFKDGDLRKGYIPEIAYLENGISLEELFSEEDVDKGVAYIHAYGYDKLTEYILKIKEFIKGRGI